MKDLDKALMLDHHYSNTVPLWVNLITDQLYFKVQYLCRIIISSKRKSIYISENSCVMFNMNYVTTDLMIFTVVPNKNEMMILSSIFSVQFLYNLWIVMPQSDPISWKYNVSGSKCFRTYRISLISMNSDALAQASDIRIERRQVVFLCWMQDSNPSGSQTPNRQQTECPLTNRLSYRGSS